MTSNDVLAYSGALRPTSAEVRRPSRRRGPRAPFARRRSAWGAESGIGETKPALHECVILLLFGCVEAAASGADERNSER